MRDCRGCDRRLPVDAFGDGTLCRRCVRLTTLAWVARDLDRRQYPYAGIVRQAARELAQRRDDDQGGCEHCGGVLPERSTGRPATFCSTRCRQTAYRRRKRDESRHSVA